MSNYIKYFFYLCGVDKYLEIFNILVNIKYIYAFILLYSNNIKFTFIYYTLFQNSTNYANLLYLFINNVKLKMPVLSRKRWDVKKILKISIFIKKENKKM